MSGSSLYGHLLASSLVPFLLLQGEAIGLTAPPIQYDLLLITSTKTLLPNKVTNQVPGGYEFWGAGTLPNPLQRLVGQYFLILSSLWW